MSDCLLNVKELFAKGASFVKGVPTLDHLPDYDLPEIAFAGRSNVGKSSLINALIGVYGLARTSNTPGRTQHLNYFLVGETFYLVDMPGYGFAKAPLAMVKQWNAMIQAYLRGRPTLKRVYLLIDARHGIKKNDEETMRLMDESASSYQVVLTKTDKIKPTGVAYLKESIEKSLIKHPAAYPNVICTSSEKGEGIIELREAIVQLLMQ